MTTLLDDPMTRAYVTCALWASSHQDGTPLDDDYGIDDLADDGGTDGVWAAWNACHRFRFAIETGGGAVTLDAVRAAGWTDDQLGHDLWLTRNGHGAGFWDRRPVDFPDAERPDTIDAVGRILTSMAAVLGESTAYVGDDGKVRFA